MKKFLLTLLLAANVAVSAQITVTGITQTGITLGPTVPQGGVAFVTTTTISEQRDNNTSACAAVNAPSVGPTACASSFPGMRQTRFPISAISRSGSTVTVTINDAYNFSSSDQVIIAGVANSTDFPGGTYSLTSVASNTLKYTQSGSAVSSSGGTATRKTNTDTFAFAPKNIANFTNDGVKVHDMIYRYTGGTATTKVYAHLMPWFSCSPATNGNCLFTPRNGTSASNLNAGLNMANSHITVGYTSHDSSGSGDTTHKQITAQIADMIRRGYDGLIIDDNGAPITAHTTTKKNSISVARKTLDALSGISNFTFAVQPDQSSWNNSATCGGTSSATPSCVEKVLKCAFDYYNTLKTNTFVCAFDGLTYAGSGFFASSKYTKDPVSNKPLTGFFIGENSWFLFCTSTSPCAVYNNGVAGVTCNSNDSCWTAIGNGLKARIESYAVVPQLIHRNTFTHSPNSSNINAGSFRWINPTGVQSNWDKGGYDSWLNTAKTSSKNVMAAGYAGVDHAQSSFQHDTLISDRRCGMTWMDSVSEANSGNPAFFSTSNQLPMMSLNTWNDYEEGTPIEPGIDSCYTVATFTIASSTVSYTLGTNNASQAPLAPLNPTLRYADLYATQDGTNAARIARLNVASSDSQNLSGLVPAGTYSVYLKIVPQNSMATIWAGPVTYVQP